MKGTSGRLRQTGSIGNIEQIVINNELIVDQDLTIEGYGTQCSTYDPQTQIVFGKDAIVNFTGPFKLTFSNCHLKACGDDMWEGILVDNPGAEIVINAGSLVEDAKNAIYAKNGGRFELDDVTFNRNYKHLLIEDYSSVNPYQSSIRNCTLKCEAMCGTALETLLEPHAEERTYAAFEINNVNNIQIGDPNYSQNTILVYDDYGIKGTGSGLTIYNNLISYYDDILAPFPCFPSCDVPYNIYLTGGSLENMVTIGGEEDNQGNVIENGYYGVYAQNNLNVFINNNTFTNINKPVIVTKLNIPGVSSGHTIEINDNAISECYSGINVTANEQAAITINDNDIALMESGATHIGPTGIAVIEPAGEYLPGNEDALMISNNDITGVQIGILVNSVGSPTTIQQNSIEFDVFGEFSNLKAFGIHVIKGEYLTIAENENITSLVGGDKTRGIQVDNSNNYTIRSNNVSNCGRGIVALGTGTIGQNTFLSCNEMEECTYGFSLEADANIGLQGDATHPSNNTWIPYTFYQISNSNGAFHTWSESVNGNMVVFRTLSGNIYANTNNGFGSGLAIQGLPATGSDDCPEIFDPPIERYEDIANGTVHYSGDTVKAKWLAKQALFNVLKRDTTLLDSSSVLSNFYDSTLTHNMGKIREIRMQIRRGVAETDPDYFDDADYINSNLSALNDLDANHKLVNDIYLTTILVGIDTFTEDQIEDLEAIAQMCYSEGGEGAYQAMALLSYAYKTPIVYDCDEIELKQSKAPQPDFILASVHPNPTSGIITIENYCLEGPLFAELVNEFGISVLSESIILGGSQSTTDLSNLPAGLYILHLNGCKTSMHQLIVKIQ